MPGFTLWSAAASFGMPIMLAGPVRATPRVRLGMARMTFADDAADWQKAEHEVLAGVSGAMSLMQGAWGLHVEASCDVVFLSQRIRPCFATVGLSRTFKTPSWLAQALQ